CAREYSNYAMDFW
nr:immunoglobulin heavy chain junction region [Mus musculus]